MRMLHATSEIAGQAGRSVLGLRQRGIEARLFAPVHPYAYDPPPDIVPPAGRVDYVRAVARVARHHDTFHFHYGDSMLRGMLDARLLSTVGRQVVVEVHGSDVRVP